MMRPDVPAEAAGPLSAHILIGEPVATSPGYALQRDELLPLHGLAQAVEGLVDAAPARQLPHRVEPAPHVRIGRVVDTDELADRHDAGAEVVGDGELVAAKIRIFRTDPVLDRKSTRLNSSHMSISYAVFCLKKKKIR